MRRERSYILQSSSKICIIVLENSFWGSVTAHPWQGDIFESELLYSYRKNYPYRIPIPIFILYLPPPNVKGANGPGLLLTSSVHFAQNKVAPKIQTFWLISESQNLAIICSVVASLLSLSVSKWHLFICSGYVYDTLNVSKHHF